MCWSVCLHGWSWGLGCNCCNIFFHVKFMSLICFWKLCMNENISRKSGASVWCQDTTAAATTVQFLFRHWISILNQYYLQNIYSDWDEKIKSMSILKLGTKIIHDASSSSFIVSTVILIFGSIASQWNCRNTVHPFLDVWFSLVLLPVNNNW